MEIPGPGDHSVATCSVAWNFQAGPTAWRISDTRKTTSAGTDEALGANSALKWTLSEDVLLAHTSIDAKWNAWCRAAEDWLVLRGFLTDAPGERPLGSRPTLRRSTHVAGASQSHEERVLRRLLRRLTEARTQAWRGRECPRLKARILASGPSSEVSDAVAKEHWGHALALATEELKALLAEAQARALAKWKHQMHTLRGAASWVKSTGPQAQIIQDESGTRYCNKAAAASALRSYWKRVFGADQRADTHRQGFCEKYAHVLTKDLPTPPLAPISVVELRASLGKMKGKAAGLDGFSPDLLCELPREGLEQLALFLNCCESCGEWPSNLTHWKLVFIPKGSSTCPSLDQVRPIAISGAVYRAWARLRLRNLADHLSRALQPWQAGGINGVDPEVLLLAAETDFDPTSRPYAAALDYKKAFDSCDFPLALEALRGLQIPPQILSLLQNQWERQIRWVTFAGVACPYPIRHSAGLPQGDPWSPVALAAVLACPKQVAEEKAPGCQNLLYLDDRTLLADTEASLQTSLQTWDEFEQVSRMRTHAAKTQFFNRAPGSTDTAEVLGACLGPAERQPSAKELQRRDRAAGIASRIGLLPVSHKFRATLAATVFGPRAGWACLFNGKRPSAQELSQYGDTFRRAVKGSDAKGDRSSRELQRVLLLGHTADLALVAIQRLLKAAARWARYRSFLGLRPSDQSLVASRPFRALRGCLPSGWQLCLQTGQCSNGQVTWSAPSSAGQQDKVSHELRESWRLQQLRTWLSSGRNDAVAARAQGLVVDCALVKRLRALASPLCGHGVAIMTGGFSPDAIWTPSGGIRGHCFSCSQNITPFSRHVMWECPSHDSLREVAVPSCPLAQRLGWGKDVEPKEVVLARLGVMANIRRADIRGRRHRAPWSGGPRDPAPD